MLLLLRLWSDEWGLLFCLSRRRLRFRIGHETTSYQLCVIGNKFNWTSLYRNWIYIEWRIVFSLSLSPLLYCNTKRWRFVISSFSSSMDINIPVYMLIARLDPIIIIIYMTVSRRTRKEGQSIVNIFVKIDRPSRPSVRPSLTKRINSNWVPLARLVQL